MSTQHDALKLDDARTSTRATSAPPRRSILAERPAPFISPSAPTSPSEKSLQTISVLSTKWPDTSTVRLRRHRIAWRAQHAAMQRRGLVR